MRINKMEFNLYKVNKRWVVNKIINKRAYCLGSFDDIKIAKKYIEMRIKYGTNNYSHANHCHNDLADLDISNQQRLDR